MATEEAANDMMRARERAAPLRWSANPGYRAVALSISYVALYLALDRVSFIGALHGIGITPWSPTAGLAMALLISKGLRYAPLVMAAELLSGATLPIISFSATPIFLGSLVVTAGYTGGAAILRHAGFQAGLRSSSDVVLLLIVTIISSEARHQAPGTRFREDPGESSGASVRGGIGYQPHRGIALRSRRMRLATPEWLKIKKVLRRIRSI